MHFLIILSLQQFTTLNGVIEPISQVALCFGFLCVNDCHAKPTTFCSLGRATFEAGKKQGEHLLVERQEQGFTSEGKFVLSIPQTRVMLKKIQLN